MPDKSKSADKKQIRALDAQWGAAACQKDLEAVVAFYARDGSLVWPEAPAVHQTGAIRKAWRKMMKTPGLGLRFTPERIDVSKSGDLAVDFGIVESAQDTPKGRQREICKYLVVWKKVNGKWKVLYDSYNSDKPDSATPTLASSKRKPKA